MLDNLVELVLMALQVMELLLESLELALRRVGLGSQELLFQAMEVVLGP